MTDEVFVLMFPWYNIKHQDLSLIIHKRTHILEGSSLRFPLQSRNIPFNKIPEISLLFTSLIDLKCDNSCRGINMYLLKIHKNMICEYVQIFCVDAGVDSLFG